MDYRDKILAEHKSFRNQCIVATAICVVAGIVMLFEPIEFPKPEDAKSMTGLLFGLSGFLGFMSLFNIATYSQNKKDLKRLREIEAEQ